MKYCIKRADLVAQAIRNAQMGYHTPMLKLIDILLVKNNLPIERIAKTAERYFGIPKEVTRHTISRYV